jgi:hypothetical protein
MMMFGITSWKTTAGGLAAILGGIGVIANMYATGGWDLHGLGTAVTGIGAGVGLLWAKDSNVSNSPSPVPARSVVGSPANGPRRPA